MASNGRGDRRQATGDFRTRPRSSPGSLVVLTVAAVLLVTAAGTALLGGGHSDATPHGRLLGTLETVAESQESHHDTTGHFAAWPQTLEVEVPEDVDLTLVRGGADQWEALVETSEVGLSCSQSGGWVNGRHYTETPVCYRDAGD